MHLCTSVAVKNVHTVLRFRAELSEKERETWKTVSDFHPPPPDRLLAHIVEVVQKSSSCIFLIEPSEQTKKFVLSCRGCIIAQYCSRQFPSLTPTMFSHAQRLRAVVD